MYFKGFWYTRQIAIHFKHLVVGTSLRPLFEDSVFWIPLIWTAIFQNPLLKKIHSLRNLNGRGFAVVNMSSLSKRALELACFPTARTQPHSMWNTTVFLELIVRESMLQHELWARFALCVNKYATLVSCTVFLFVRPCKSCLIEKNNFH